MTTSQNQQWIRKLGLVVFNGEEGLDLSEMHVVFRVNAMDEEIPNNAVIRVYNLSDVTARKIQGEFSQVSLSAGYENGNYGMIFKGTIKQFRMGRENATDKYYDIIAADGDEPYNWAFSNATLPAGISQQEAIEQAARDMGIPVNKMSTETQDFANPTGGILPRGKVLFGMSRRIIRNSTNSIGCSWSIQNGEVQILPLDGYLPNEAVVLNGKTGLIGFPQQTDEGIKIECLLNPRILVGQLVQIDNASINKTISQTQQAAGVQAVGWQAPLMLAMTEAFDGIYRVYVAEHKGDTRGQPWFSYLTCLAVDPTSQKVEAP